MKDSSEFEEKLMRISQHPPPYTVENTGSVHHILAIPDVDLVLSNATGNISSDSSHLLIQSLGRLKRFTMVRKGRLGCINKTIIIQIRDSTKRPIFSVVKIPGRNISTTGTNNSSAKIRSVIQMINSFGQTLLTGEESDQFVTVSSGEQLLGTIRWSLSPSLNITVESIMGEPLFESVEECGASGSAFSSRSLEFSFVSNGVTLGHVKKSINNSSNYEIILLSSRHLDSRTKALLIFTGYFIGLHSATLELVDYAKRYKGYGIDGFVCALSLFIFLWCYLFGFET